MWPSLRLRPLICRVSVPFRTCWNEISKQQPWTETVVKDNKNNSNFLHSSTVDPLPPSPHIFFSTILTVFSQTEATYDESQSPVQFKIDECM